TVLAGFYFKAKKFKKALYYNQLAIQYAAIQNFSLDQPSSNYKITPTILDQLESSSQNAELLANHAKYLLSYLDQENTSEAWGYVEQLLLKALNFYEEQRTLDISLRYKKVFQEVTRLLQNLYLRQNEIEKAFHVAERSKVNSAQLAFMSYQSYQEMDIPMELVEDQLVNESKIARLEEAIFDLEKDNNLSNDSLIQKHYAAIFDLKKKNEKLLLKLSQRHPLYEKIVRNNEVISISNLQKSIDGSTLLLYYLVNDDKLDMFLIRQKGTIEWKQIKTTELVVLLSRFRELNSKYEANTFEEWISLSTKLKELLIPVVASNFEKLVIIPDQSLHFLPFEVLCDTKENMAKDFSEVDFLIKQHNISYASSASLWYQQQNVQQKNYKYSWVGYAPAYREYVVTEQDTQQNQLLTMLVRDGNLPLPAAQEEVKEIRKIMDGEIFIGGEATESHFKQHAKDYQIIHLAMHTLLEDASPLYTKLLFEQKDDFENGTLTIAELHTLKLNAELAVLSACNTGVGAWLPGEGVASLSQAFTAARCPSTVMSLWQVPDRETSTLMVNFYKQLNGGKRKDEALRQAKLAYLEEVENPRLAHPYFWASFILSGNVTSIKTLNSFDFLWGGGILLLTLAMALFIRWQRT
ncbi:MAG: CHAT domain-containing protein, partial [Bacteroidota bacterium]